MTLFTIHSGLLEKIASLTREKNEVYEKIKDIGSEFSDDDQVSKIIDDIKQEMSEIRMWNKRKLLLEYLQSDIKPVSSIEEMGRFDRESFPLESSSQLNSFFSSSKDSSQLVELTPSAVDKSLDSYDPEKPHGSVVIKNSVYSDTKTLNSELLRPAEFQSLLNSNPSLKSALSFLKGKESYLITSQESKQIRSKSIKPSSKEQNMVAWTTLQVSNEQQ